MSTLHWQSLYGWFRRHWILTRKILVAGFIALVLMLLGIAVVKVDWNDVQAALRQLPTQTLWMAAVITVGSYVVYGIFDLLGKWYTAHDLVWWRTMMIGFVSYAFNMSMGASIGGVGLRMRLYAKHGLQQGVVMRVVGLSLVTNWTGYALLAGCVFAAGVVPLPDGWGFDTEPLRFIGVLMIAASVAYLGMCAFSVRRSWVFFGHKIELPSFGLAVVQIIVAIVSWSLMALIIYVLLQQHVPYLTVLGVLLISAIAGTLSRIPGGLGVIEAVFVIFVGGAMGRSQVLSAMLVYRAIYYICPLVLAGLWYLGTEVKMRTPARHNNCSLK